MSLCFCGVVKTTLRLQTNYNVLLVCLAGTDLLVGIVVQPSFIVAQVYVITGRSPKRKRSFLDPRYSYIIIFASPTLISVVRFVAIKHTYRYTTFFTARSLTLVGLGMFANLHFLIDGLKRTMSVFRASFTFINVSVMIYCHISVYFVSSRHKNRI